MCGIAGGFWKQAPRDAKRLLNDAVKCMWLRGPNDRGVEMEDVGGGTLAFGHARLSVIDLSVGGHQPMHTPDGRLSIVFNGEIYNHRELRATLEAMGSRFVSASDTEVLLQAWAQWGEACLTKLDGMFAFVVHDRAANTLTACRDGFGIKPFFYVVEQGSFLFASTQTALVALRGRPPRANWQRCYDYLVHADYDSSVESFVADVRHLPPAHFITVDLATAAVVSIRKWWTPSIRERGATSFADAAEMVRAAFLDAVRLQMRSDVSIGAALSGGIDSSAVVCAMRHVEPSLDIDTFTYVASGTPLNEERWADLVNTQVGARAHKVEATERDLLADLDDMLVAQDEPFGSTSIYAQYRVFRLAREHGVTVTLDGQGADEMLAGYSGYPGFRLLSLLERGCIGEAHAFARQWARWPGRSYKLAMMELGRVVMPDELYSVARRQIGRDFKPRWLNIDAFEQRGVRFRENRVPRSPEASGRRVIEQLSKSLQERGVQALLRHADRNSMRFSVESRVPFLTARMVDLLLGLPENHLISPSGETKSVFRAAMRGIVPDAILDRRDKIGFATPEQQWLTALAPQLRAVLAADAGSIPLLRREPLLDAFDAVIAGRQRFSWQLWRWYNFVRWYTGFGLQP